MRAIAEFEPVETLWLCWPHNPNDWPGKIEAARWAFVEFVRAAVEDSDLQVVILVPSVLDDKVLAKLRKGVSSSGMQRVTLLGAKTDRGWMRDIGPSWVEDQGSRLPVFWEFTAWGHKYKNFALDAKVGARVVPPYLHKRLMAQREGTPIVLEGGAIDVNGCGALLTTRECLLDPMIQVRNPGFTQEDYEAVFRFHLGINQVIWLEGGILGDDTHGHIDDVARFADPVTIVAAVADPGDPNEAVLAANLDILRRATQPGSVTGYRICEVPLPVVMFDGERLPASYANFLILNDRVLVPTFNSIHDAEALRVIGQAVRRVAVGVSAVDLVWGYGTLHCLSHLVPRAKA